MPRRGQAVAAIYSTFLQRGYDQVFQEIALQRLGVVLALDRAGLVGQDGPTHNGVFDIAYLRPLPGFVLCSPRDDSEMGLMLRFALDCGYPVALRYPRAKTPVALAGEERAPLELGRAEWIERGERVAILSYGPMAMAALEASAILADEGIHPSLINARFVKPLDVEMLQAVGSSHDLIVTLEDHSLVGGFGAACLEALNDLEAVRARLVRIGVPDRFVEHMDSPGAQHAALGMDGAGIARRIREELSRG